MDRRLSPRNFDNDLELVAAKTYTLDGAPYARGQTIPAELPHSMRMRLWMSARAIYRKDFKPTPTADDAEAEAAKVAEAEVTLGHVGGGWYEVKAPWLPEPVRIRGKEEAEAKAAELRQQGAPTGPDWDGYDPDPSKWTAAQDEAFAAWYEGLADDADLSGVPEHVAGEVVTRRAAAEEARKAAEWDSDDVAILEAEGGNGWYEIHSLGVDEPEKVHGWDAALARATELRQAKVAGS